MEMIVENASVGAVVAGLCVSSDQAQVVLTREAGKNEKLMKALHEKGVPCLEMPLVETSKGPDR